MCYRMLDKDADRLAKGAGELKPRGDQEFIAASEAVQRADQAAFARFVARLAQWRASRAHRSEESVS